MITRKQINKVVGEFVDKALSDYGIPAERRTTDDPDTIERRSTRILLERLRIEPMGKFRMLHQDVTVYFYPEDEDAYRDECWMAVDALEYALTAPLIVDGAFLHNEEEIEADMTSNYVQISFSLVWGEVADDDSVETIEEIEMEV